MFFVKSLKLVLPLATATAATIVTASLVSFRKEDLRKQELNQEKLLDDIEISVEEFKEEAKFYLETPEEKKENRKDLEKVKEKEKEEKGIKSLKEVEEVFHNTVELMKKAQTGDKVDQMNIQLPTQLSSEALPKEKEPLEQTPASKEETIAQNNQEGTNFGSPLGQEESKAENDIQPTVPETELSGDVGTLAEDTQEAHVQSSETAQLETTKSEESQHSQEIEAISEGSVVQAEDLTGEREQIAQQFQDNKLSERDSDSSSENSTMTLEHLNELLALQGKLSKSFNELGDLVRSFE